MWEKFSLIRYRLSVLTATTKIRELETSGSVNQSEHPDDDSSSEESGEESDSSAYEDVNEDMVENGSNYEDAPGDFEFDSGTTTNQGHYTGVPSAPGNRINGIAVRNLLPWSFRKSTMRRNNWNNEKAES